ncbi:MAG: PilZ domain-containing protein [Candidatus Sulfobium sp.]
MRTRRQYRRFIRRLEVEFSSSGRYYRGISSNFSLGGLFVRTNHPFSPGTLIDLTVHLPGGEEAVLKGKVKMALKSPVVSLKSGMGIQILERDKAFVDFVGSLEDEAPAEEKSAGTEPLPEHESDAAARPVQEDFLIVACPGCGARNRVRKSRTSQTLKCGKCGASLTPPA